ncbi:MAG: hypothetical protein FJW64_13855 [Actinobacteria bacterium]|nr:hypothetical protein [Actinomycetota bacterium]
MRRIVYAGGSFLTSTEIAGTLMRLAVGVAVLGGTELVEVPVCVDTERTDTAELMIGPGLPLLNLPVEWRGEEPDFTAENLMLQMRTSYPATGGNGDALSADSGAPWSADFDEW